MREFEIDVKAFGFQPSEQVVVAVGDAFEGRDPFVDPVVSGDLRAGALEVSVEVVAASEAAARQLVESALGEALVAIGVVSGWTKVTSGQAVIA